MTEHCNIAVAAVAEQRSYSFVVKIDGYSRTKVLVRKGEYVKSTPFSFAGHNWVVKYYPLGNYTDGCVAFFLVLDSSDVKDLRVETRFCLLDKSGKPVPSYNRTTTQHLIPGIYQEIFLSSIIHDTLEESVLLGDDCFSIRFDVTVPKEATSKGNKFVMVPPRDLNQQLGNLLLKNMDGADVTFQVGGERFSAHRSVLAAQSSVLRAELFGGMRENSCDPIKIDDMEAEVFKSLLHFIYTDSLSDLAPEGTDMGATRGGGDVVAASHLLVAADRYNIERLKLICEEKLCNHIDCNMVATTLALAEQHSCRGLKEACFEFLALPSNLEAMVASDGFEHLKSSCPSVLKELIARLLPVELKAIRDIIMAI